MGRCSYDPNRCKFCAADSSSCSAALVPLFRLVYVLSNAFADFIQRTEIILRSWMSQLGGFTIPACGFRIILSDTVTILIHHTEVVLYNTVILLGGFVIPAHGFCIILGDS